MKAGFRKYWRVFRMFTTMRIMMMMEYRTDFLFWTIVSTMWTVFNIFFFTLLTGVTGSIGSWNQTEMFLLLGVFTILDGFTWSFFFPNMSDYTKAIFSGDFNLILLRPIDAQFLTMAQRFDFDSCLRFAIGIGTVVVAIHRLPHQPTLLTLLAFILLICCSIVLIYSLWFIVATGAFWIDRLENINEIIPSVRRLWQIPRSVLSGVTSTLFTVILPLGLVSSIPSEVMLGRSEAGWLIYFIAITAVLFLFSRWFFHFSLRKYGSVGN